MTAQSENRQQAQPSPAQAATMAAAARPTRLTGRVTLRLAYPVREFIERRQQIDQRLALQLADAAQSQALKQQNGKLTQSWYVEQQAEDELHMCYPNEQCYEVVSGQSAQAALAKQQLVTNPWYDATLSQSVHRSEAEPRQ